MKQETVFKLPAAFAEYLNRIEHGVAEQEEIKRRADIEIQTLSRVAGGVGSYVMFASGLTGEWRVDRKRNVLVKVEDEQLKEQSANSVDAAGSDDLSDVLRSAERECGESGVGVAGTEDHSVAHQRDS